MYLVSVMSESRIKTYKIIKLQLTKCIFFKKIFKCQDLKSPYSVLKDKDLTTELLC